VKSNQKQPSCKRVCGLEEGCCEENHEIQGSIQELAVMATRLMVKIMTILGILVPNPGESIQIQLNCHC